VRKVLCMAALVVLALANLGCTETEQGVYSADIPDPTTQFLQARDSIYAALENAGTVTVGLRIAYIRVAIRSYAQGFETYDEFLMRLARADFPEGAALTARAYRLKCIITWLRRGEISLESADQALAELYDEWERGMQRW